MPMAEPTSIGFAPNTRYDHLEGDLRMKISVRKEDCDSVYVDRDSVRAWHGRQGFEINFEGWMIHFEDELDAERLAEKVLIRLGKMNEGGKK
jgi:hypothetical protein